MKTGADQSALRSALVLDPVVGPDLLRVDWAATPLGPPEDWPQSLVTMVRVMLASRFSMWMAWGPELTFFCNAAYRRDTLGRKYPWALGRPAQEVWEEIWPEIGPRIATVMTTGQATWDEALMLILERSGYPEETYHTFSYSPIPDDDGSIAGMLCVVAEETDRVLALRQMALLRDLGAISTADSNERRFLGEAAQRLQAEDQALPFSLVYLYDETGGAELVAAAGVQPGEEVAPHAIPPGSVAPWPLETATSGPVTVTDLGARFSELPCGAWDRPPQQALLMPLGQAGGRPFGGLVCGINPHRVLDEPHRTFISLIGQRLAAGIASARSLAEERARAAQLAELDRSKTTFFSNVSHEFRTPLTLMLAPLQDALADSTVLDTDGVEMVHRNGLRLLKLVNALLDFSRIEAGRMRADFRPADIGHLTAELAGTFSDATRRGGLELRIDCPVPTGTVYLDADMWERIVLNLLSNAFKVTMRGSITVKLREIEGAVELSVADTGPGIAPADLPHLFQRFHRVRATEARSHEGSGIGLALVEELTQLHGGEVDVRSELGRGSEFVVRIPFGRAHLPADQVGEEPREPSREIAGLFVEEALSWAGVGNGRTPDAGPLGAPRPRVLVADDNPDLRTYLARLLSPRFEVETVGDGQHALERIHADRPDLLITDAMMPRMDGFELLQELRADPETSALPVIMLSARAGEEASIAGLEAGADDYLPKPFSGRELLARVGAHVELALVRDAAADEVRAERMRLEQALEQMPAGVILAEAPSGRILSANRQVSEILGPLPSGTDSVEGYRVYAPGHEDGDPLPLSQRPLGRALGGGHPVQDELLRFPGADETMRYMRVSAAPIRNERGEVSEGVLVLQDVTDRERDNRMLAAQRDILAMIARGAPLSETLEQIVYSGQGLSDHRSRGAVMLVDPARRRLRLAAGPDLPAEARMTIDGTEISAFSASCGTAAYRAETVIVENIADDPLWKEQREGMLSSGLRGCWSVPIFASAGDVVGTYDVYHERPVGPTESDRRVIGLLARSAAVAIERSRDAAALARQLAELQTSLLPRQLANVPGLQAAAAYHPGDRSLEVGGDFYDLFPLGGGRWGFVIGDVCGHGAEAAAVTALVRHTARAIARQHHDPAAVLAFVSDAMADSAQNRFCTAVFGVLEPRDGGVAFRLANGGHPPPLLRRAGGKVMAVDQHGPLLGVFPHPEFPQVEGELGPGDALLLHTDGLYERNPRISGEDGLHALLARLSAPGADELLRALEVAALGTPPVTVDDVAVLVMQAR